MNLGPQGRQRRWLSREIEKAPISKHDGATLADYAPGLRPKPAPPDPDLYLVISVSPDRAQVLTYLSEATSIEHIA